MENSNKNTRGGYRPRNANNAPFSRARDLDDDPEPLIATQHRAAQQQAQQQAQQAQRSSHRPATNHPSSPSNTLPRPPKANKPFPNSPSTSTTHRRIHFQDYLPLPQLAMGIQTGSLFRATFRVNGRDRSEAYITLPGYPEDILIKGDRKQNRAVDGDEVVIRFLPIEYWFVKTTNQEAKNAQRVTASERNQAADSFLTEALASLSVQDKSEVNLAASRAVADANGLPRANNLPALRASVAALKKQLATLLVGTRVTAEVVGIARATPRRETIVGRLVSQGKKQFQLIPHDTKMPYTYVRLSLIDVAFHDSLLALPRGEAHDHLFIGSLTEWPVDSTRPHASACRVLGPAGDLKTERQAILIRKLTPAPDFPPATIDDLPLASWSIPAVEWKTRRDVTGLRVVSIDPPDAKDLDDALSVRPITMDEATTLVQQALRGRDEAVAKSRHVVPFDGPPKTPPVAPYPILSSSSSSSPKQLYEVGVHIADVSYFLTPHSSLDREARMRATSTYCVHTVIPMLPHRLCQELCSLNPNVDRLSFSFFFVMDDEGKVYAEWPARTIMRSVARLTYGDAQGIIEAAGATPANRPASVQSDELWKQVVSDVLLLQQLAVALRKGRFDKGALRLDQPRLKFRLDPATTEPVECSIYEIHDSNRLIEEFMLLANQATARRVSSCFPDHALLRCHPPPQSARINRALRALKSKGVWGALGSIATQLADLVGDEDDNDERDGSGDVVPSGLLQSLLSTLQSSELVASNPNLMYFTMNKLTRSMELAKYYATGENHEPVYDHYALAMLHYTHFTSPIRRYADVLVHRLLAATMMHHDHDNDNEKSASEQVISSSSPLASTLPAGLLPSQELADVAMHLNACKLNAREAQDASIALHLAYMIQQRGGMNTKGLVLDVRGNLFFSVLVPELAMEVRIEMNTLTPRAFGVYSETLPSLRIQGEGGLDVMIRELDEIPIRLETRITRQGLTLFACPLPFGIMDKIVQGGGHVREAVLVEASDEDEDFAD